MKYFNKYPSSAEDIIQKDEILRKSNSRENQKGNYLNKIAEDIVNSENIRKSKSRKNNISESNFTIEDKTSIENKIVSIK